MSLLNAPIPNQDIPVMLATPDDLPDIVARLKQGKVLVVFEYCLEAAQRAALQKELSREYAHGRISGYFMMGTTEYLAAYVSPLPDPDAAATAATTSSQSALTSSQLAPTSSQLAPTSSQPDHAVVSNAASSHLVAQPTTSAKTRAKRSGRRHHLPTKVERALSKARCRMHAPSALKQH